MGLFNRKRPLATNAPRHWPPIAAEALDPDDRRQRAAIVLKGMLEEFGPKGIDVRPVDVLQFRMFPEGFLEIPLEVEEAGKRFPIFIYPAATAEAAGHYAAARQMLRERAGQTAIYYCPDPIQPAKPTSACETFATGMLSNLDEEAHPPGGNYALWWSTPDQPRFSASPAREYMTRAFKAFDRIEPLLFLSFVVDLGLMEKEPQGPVALPSEELIHPVEGPEKRSLLLCVSAEKGISFSFHVPTTTVAYRDLFLRHYAEFCESLAGQIRAEGVTDLHEGGDTPLGWWEFLGQVTEKNEVQEPTAQQSMIGLVQWPDPEGSTIDQSG